MKKNWIVIYYEDKEGACPVKDFIISRKENNRAKIMAQISYLEELGLIIQAPMLIILRQEFMS